MDKHEQCSSVFSGTDNDTANSCAADDGEPKRRGRKAQQFSAYCDRVQAQIGKLREILEDPATTDERKRQLRNQISAH